MDRTRKEQLSPYFIEKEQRCREVSDGLRPQVVTGRTPPEQSPGPAPSCGFVPPLPASDRLRGVRPVPLCASSADLPLLQGIVRPLLSWHYEKIEACPSVVSDEWLRVTSVG